MELTKSRILAGIHILCGILSLIVETVKVSSTFHEKEMSTFGEGFYCGLVFIGAGVFELGRGNNERIKMERISFGLSVLTIVCGGWMVLVSGSILIGSLMHTSFIFPIIVHFFMTLCGLVEIVTGIFSTSSGCYRHCYCCYKCCYCCFATKATAEDSMKVAHATFQEDNTTDVVIKDSDQVVNEVRNNMEETNNKSSGYSRFP